MRGHTDTDSMEKAKAWTCSFQIKLQWISWSWSVYASVTVDHLIIIRIYFCYSGSADHDLYSGSADHDLYMLLLQWISWPRSAYTSVIVNHLIMTCICFCYSGSADHDLYSGSADHDLHILLLQWITWSWPVYASVTVNHLIMTCICFCYSGSADHDLHGLFHCGGPNHEHDTRFCLHHDVAVPRRPASRAGPAGRRRWAGKTAAARR
jgi:hypothetical protein